MGDGSGPGAGAAVSAASGWSGRHPLLLYDGRCGLCARSVQFVLRHERTRTLRFAPLDSRTGLAVRARHPELAAVESMMWVEQDPGRGGERVLTRSRAALEVLAYIGGPWRFAGIARAVPAVLRDAAYDFVARHRHRLDASAPSCLVPTPEQRARFLD